MKWRTRLAIVICVVLLIAGAALALWGLWQLQQPIPRWHMYRGS
jgi:hypothetical protein